MENPAKILELPVLGAWWEIEEKMFPRKCDFKNSENLTVIHHAGSRLCPLYQAPSPSSSIGDELNKK